MTMPERVEPIQDTEPILVIGKICPPIGGVTIHVTRLLAWLDLWQVSHVHYDLRNFKLLTFLIALKKHSLAHLHSSHAWLMLVFSMCCKLFRTQSILTYHGDVGRRSFCMNAIEGFAMRMCNHVIVLNSDSLKKATRYNSHAQIISAFIPPTTEEALPGEIQVSLDQWRHSYRKIICSNAFRLAYDSQGQEIYRILELVRLFQALPNFGLVISDPSGEYVAYFQKHPELLSDNIRIFEIPHSFYAMMQQTDGVIRNTTTDGDSLTVREALSLGKPVLATSVVPRPDGTILYEMGDLNELRQALVQSALTDKPTDLPHGAKELMELYVFILNSQSS